MLYLDFLAAFHERFAPRTYLEIGVHKGNSLALSRCRSIGVDPELDVPGTVAARVSLVRARSDEYFAALEQAGETPFGDLPVDLAYIDGMHHFEDALADFIGVERYARPTSVVAIDDVLPRNVEEAARERHTVAWTGDVFRLAEALRSRRPDLALILVDTEPTGTLLVGNLDPTNRTLEAAFDDITRSYVEPDPQSVPTAVLEREGAMRPEEVLGLPLWKRLREHRPTR